MLAAEAPIAGVACTSSFLADTMLIARLRANTSLFAGANRARKAFLADACAIDTGPMGGTLIAVRVLHALLPVTVLPVPAFLAKAASVEAKTMFTLGHIADLHLAVDARIEGLAFADTSATRSCGKAVAVATAV